MGFDWVVVNINEVGDWVSVVDTESEGPEFGGGASAFHKHGVLSGALDEEGVLFEDLFG